MKKFSVAFRVCGTIELEAQDKKEALAKFKQLSNSELVKGLNLDNTDEIENYEENVLEIP